LAVRNRFMLTAVAVVAVLAFQESASGQFNRSGSGSNISSSAMRASSSTTSMFGSRSSGQGSSTGNRSFLGGSGSDGSSGSARSSMGGATGDQLLRSSRGAQAFVGADTGDTRNFIGFTDAGTGSSRSTSASGLSNYRRSSTYLGNSPYSRGGYYGSGRYGRTTTTVRPTLELGFNHAAPAPEPLATGLAHRLNQASSLGFVQAAGVSLENGTAVLRGSVASDHQRALAEQLLLLEPGVRRVDNQLTVTAEAKK